MAGVYGDFVENFPELYESFSVWKDDRNQAKDIRAIYMPDEGGDISRRKYTSGNTGLDITDSDLLYVPQVFADSVGIGYYITWKDDPNTIMRLTHVINYKKAAGYAIYEIQRVTGANENKTEGLDVKEAVFA